MTIITAGPRKKPGFAPRPLDVRLFEKVDRSRQCWMWTGSVNKKGYGVLNVAGVPRLAHRISFEIAAGAPPGRMAVCHHCDVPACVNPEHLFLGTIADNNADMLQKGRASGGSRPGTLATAAKLTDAQVIEMRGLSRDGVNAAEIGRRFGVAHQTAWRVIRGLGWRHVP